MGTACRSRRLRRAIHRHYRCRPMAMATDTDMGMDVSMRLTEGRGARRATHQDHLYIRHYLCGLRGYLRNRLCRSAMEGVGTSEKGREIGIGIESGEGSESEGDMEHQSRRAGMGMEETGAAVEVCRTHRVRGCIVFSQSPLLRHCPVAVYR